MVRTIIILIVRAIISVVVKQVDIITIISIIINIIDKNFIDVRVVLEDNSYFIRTIMTIRTSSQVLVAIVIKVNILIFLLLCKDFIHHPYMFQLLIRFLNFHQV